MTDAKQQQVMKLERECKTRIAPSKVHGVGVFAMRELKNGEKLHADVMPCVYSLTATDLKKVRPEIREMILEQWPQILNGSKFAYPTTRIQAYMNHSETPNYDAQGDVMLADVAPGEEILEDYRRIPNHAEAMPWLLKKPRKKKQ